MPKRGREETFAGQLRELRRAAGLSKYEVAKRAGLSDQAIGKLEAGAKPSWDTVRKLAFVFGVSVTAFEVGPVPVPDEAMRRAEGRREG